MTSLAAIKSQARAISLENEVAEIVTDLQTNCDAEAAVCKLVQSVQGSVAFESSSFCKAVEDGLLGNIDSLLDDSSLPYGITWCLNMVYTSTAYLWVSKREGEHASSAASMKLVLQRLARIVSFYRHPIGCMTSKLGPQVLAAIQSLLTSLALGAKQVRHETCSCLQSLAVICITGTLLQHCVDASDLRATCTSLQLLAC
jgi:hypothetical protein